MIKLEFSSEKHVIKKKGKIRCMRCGVTEKCRPMPECPDSPNGNHKFHMATEEHPMLSTLTLSCRFSKPKSIPSMQSPTCR